MIDVFVEETDTFGGEANYSWVRRHTFKVPPTIDTRSLVRKAKAVAGWANKRCRRETYGECVALYPRGECTVLFITWA